MWGERAGVALELIFFSPLPFPLLFVLFFPLKNGFFNGRSLQKAHLEIFVLNEMAYSFPSHFTRKSVDLSISILKSHLKLQVFFCQHVQEKF